MDKFGIFKLLNSFFDFYKQRSSEQNGNLPENPLSLFSAPATNSSVQSPPPQKQESGNTEKVKEKKPPLQSEMLFTIKNHDDIVKRVKNNK